jgi:hypothetical protein
MVRIGMASMTGSPTFSGCTRHWPWLVSGHTADLSPARHHGTASQVCMTGVPRRA